LDFPEAYELADLGGIKRDLEWVVTVGIKYDAVWANHDFFILEALSTAIIIMYGRANVKGVRRIIPHEMIKSLSLEQQKDHKYFMDLRDKFIAHSVNDFEECYCVAAIKNVQSSNPEFDQVNIQLHRIIALSVGDIKKIVSLAEILIEKIESLIKSEKYRVTDIAKKIPMNDLVNNKFPSAKSTIETAGKQRRKRIS